MQQAMERQRSAATLNNRSTLVRNADMLKSGDKGADESEYLTHNMNRKSENNHDFAFHGGTGKTRKGGGLRADDNGDDGHDAIRSEL